MNKITTSSWPFSSDHVHAWAYADAAFTPEECNHIIKFGTIDPLNDSSIGNGNSNNGYRNSKVKWIFPCEEIDWVYKRLTDIITELNSNYFKFDLYGFNEGLQFTQYDAPAGHYDLHTDTAFEGQIRKLSVVIQLSDPLEYEGGNLELIKSKEPIILSKTQGTVLLFPSYMAHQVTAVTKGRRYSLVSWITGPNFR
jgi:PKHD-type hydroxylase